MSIVNIIKEPEYYYPAGMAEQDGLMTYQESQKLDSIPTPSNIVTKSSTAGLIKNDGTVDTNSYAKESDIELEKTATGNPITLTDAVSGNALEVSAEIVASQSGSGTPSPTNIRPISGFSSVVITREDAQGHTATVTVALGSTVYGGTLNLTTGELTITHAIVDLGTLTYGKTGNDSKAFSTNSIKTEIKPCAWSSEITTAICSQYSAETGSNVYILKTDGIFGVDANGQVYFYDSRFEAETAANIKTALSGVQLCYELASPTTTTLTAAQLALVKGYNQLTCNSGDMTLTYKASGLDALKERVDDLEDAVADIETELTVMSKTRYTITSSSWSASANVSGYYTYSLTLTTLLSTSYAPNIYISGASDSTFPTDTEKAQFSYLDECNLSASNTLVLYAKTKPTSTFYVYVEGQNA